MCHSISKTRKGRFFVRVDKTGEIRRLAPQTESEAVGVAARFADTAGGPVTLFEKIGRGINARCEKVVTAFPSA